MVVVRGEGVRRCYGVEVTVVQFAEEVGGGWVEEEAVDVILDDL